MFCYKCTVIPSEYLSSVFSLENKVAVVIGGTGVLCGEMAEALAAAGAETVLVGRSEEKAMARLADIEAVGGKAFFEKVDVNSKASIQELLDNALAKSLHAAGHEVSLLPMYLPLMLDEDQLPQADSPIFFGGINVFLEQKLKLRIPCYFAIADFRLH